MSAVTQRESKLVSTSDWRCARAFSTGQASRETRGVTRPASIRTQSTRMVSRTRTPRARRSMIASTAY